MRATALILIFTIVFCTPIGAFASGSEQNTAYLVCEYDAQRELVICSVVYFGEEVSAIGFTVEYDADLLWFTGYSRGSGFLGFTTLATLEDNGRINALSHSGEGLGSGEVIKLCFKVKDTERAEKIHFALLPLTEKPAAVIENGVVRAVDVCFVGAKCDIFSPMPRLECFGADASGGIILSADHEIFGGCHFDITVVELSGNIRRTCVDADLLDGKFFIETGGMSGGYTSVIVEPHYFENGKKIFIERGIYLFYNGEYIG